MPSVQNVILVGR